MGLLSAVSGGRDLTKSRRSSNASGAGGEEGGENNPNDTSQLDKDEGNILLAIIAQLRPGMDLSKIALPTFVLEPRSLLERITDFFAHPDLIFGTAELPDAEARFIKVMTYYLSGWHIKPRGAKHAPLNDDTLSPTNTPLSWFRRYNPVLGEFFRCSYFFEDGSEGFYIAEQVSHHPPVSAFFYVSPKNGLLVTGELKPKSKFLGNSAATIMEGEDRIRLLNKPEDGEYVITMPNTYARGILFGKLILELCDVSAIDNPQTEYHCDVDFKAKGWISGGYHHIQGMVKGPGKSDVGEVSGRWNSVIEYADKKSGKKGVLFDANTAKSVPKTVLPESEQEENESRRLWSKLTDAIKSADMHGATAAKTAVEDRQRGLVKQREAAGQSAPEPKFFKNVEGDRWMPKLDVDNLPKDPIEMEDKVRKWIFGDNPPKRPAPGAEARAGSISGGSPGTASQAAAAPGGSSALGHFAAS
ncbi:Oxysterol-binding protein homolog 6 [Saitozyma sp. JCM 24511]|nr:Oxysterol-binding protein homolog 6 [Saitozyma sp. JCM 24511]